MTKIDLSKEYKSYYQAGRKPELQYFEKISYISIEGRGDPSGKMFAENIQALYATAYTIKFLNKSNNQDFVVAKLEGLWYFDEDKYQNLTIETSPRLVPRSEWYYTIMIRMPDFVNTDQCKQARESVVKRKGIVMAEEVQWLEREAGNVVQMLHIGPFDTEPESLLQIQDFMTTNNLKRNGHHHEIYLSDFRKTPSENLKTILREPVK